MPGRTPTTSSTGALLGRAGVAIFGGHLTLPRASSATSAAVALTWPFADDFWAERVSALDAGFSDFDPHAVNRLALHSANATIAARMKLPSNVEKSMWDSIRRAGRLESSEHSEARRCAAVLTPR